MERGGIYTAKFLPVHGRACIRTEVFYARNGPKLRPACAGKGARGSERRSEMQTKGIWRIDGRSTDGRQGRFAIAGHGHVKIGHSPCSTPMAQKRDRRDRILPLPYSTGPRTLPAVAGRLRHHVATTWPKLAARPLAWLAAFKQPRSHWQGDVW